MMKNQPEMAKATFSVKSEWNGGFGVTSDAKIFAWVVKLFKGLVSTR